MFSLRKPALLLATTIFSMTLLTGCFSGSAASKESYPEYDSCELKVEQFGANSDTSPYFCYLKAADGKHYDSLVRYDINSGETTELFSVDYSQDDFIAEWDLEGNTANLKVKYLDPRYYQCDIVTGEVTELSNNPLVRPTDRDYTQVSVDCGGNGNVTFKKTFGETAIYYSTDGSNYEKLYEPSDFTYKNSGLYDSYFTYTEGKIYGKVTALPLLIRGGAELYYLYEDDFAGILKEFLFSFDPATGKFQVLYETGNSYSSIIGYHNDNIYFYKTGAIYKMSLSEKKSAEFVCDADVKNAIFKCIGTKILVFNPDKGKVVAIVDMQ